MRILITFLLTGALLFCAAPAVATDKNAGSGMVAETLNVDAYVYVRLEEDDTWIASTPTRVSVGDQVEYSGGALMTGFYSPSLDRTFEKILFAMTLEVVTPEGDDSPSKQFAVAHGAAGAHAGRANNVSPPSPGEIPIIDGGGTISNIYSGYPGHDGRTVSVRARVMKVSKNIMGKNWVTLQDGTGTAPGDKLMARTLENVTVGETVVVTGVIANDVSLGYGYDYKVLLEEAEFSQ